MTSSKKWLALGIVAVLVAIPTFTNFKTSGTMKSNRTAMQGKLTLNKPVKNDPQMQVTGQIVDISSTEIGYTIKIQVNSSTNVSIKTDVMSITLNPETKIIKGTKDIKASDLQTGDNVNVTVSGVKQGRIDTAMAKTITVVK